MKHIRWFPQSGVPKSLILAVVMNSTFFYSFGLCRVGGCLSGEEGIVYRYSGTTPGNSHPKTTSELSGFGCRLY